MVDDRIVDMVRVIALLAVALLAWREFRSIRMRINQDKRRREDQARRDQTPPDAL